MHRWRPIHELSATEFAFLRRQRPVPPSLEVSCQPGQTSFAIVEQADTGFHWEFHSADNFQRDGGREESMEQAKLTAQEAMRLWVHRCPSAGQSHCHGFCETVNRCFTPQGVSVGTDHQVR